MSEATQKSFDAIVQQEDNFTFVSIPFSPRAVWGSRRNYPVSGTINGLPVRGTLGASGQDYFLRLAAKWLKASGIEPGGKVSMVLSITAPRGDTSA